MQAVRFGAVAMMLALVACSKPASDVREQTKAQQARSGEQIQQAEAQGQQSPAEKAARDAAGGADNADYYTKLPLAEFMAHVMQYAGDGIWKRQGWIVDKNGERSLFPKNEEEWEQAESGARTLAEVTNVLLIPGRRVPDPAWDKAAAGVRAVALEAAEAAERKDADAWFEAGGKLDEACDACHERFDPTFQKQRVK